MMYIIDRFEGEWAVIEGPNKKLFSLPKELCRNCKEGDVVRISIAVDDETTMKRKNEIADKFKNFFDQ